MMDHLDGGLTLTGAAGIEQQRHRLDHIEGHTVDDGKSAGRWIRRMGGRGVDLRQRAQQADLDEVRIAGALQDGAKGRTDRKRDKTDLTCAPAFGKLHPRWIGLLSRGRSIPIRPQPGALMPVAPPTEPSRRRKRSGRRPGFRSAWNRNSSNDSGEAWTRIHTRQIFCLIIL